MPRCTETPPAIIAKLRALASTNAPKTTNANVRSLVSRSVTRASAAIASPPTRGIAEYAARLASTLCRASRLRSESTSTETAPIITAGAGPHSAIASTRAKNVPVTRSALCLSASRSLAIASASSTTTSPTGRQSSAVEEAMAATSVPRRITASAARSLLERAGMEVVSGGTPESEPPVPSQPSGSSRDVPLERPVAGAARQGRRSEGIPLVFRGSRTPPGGDRRPPISGETLREGPLVGDAGEVQPVRRRRAAGLGPRAALQPRAEAPDGAAPAGALEHRADEHAVHVAHERVGLDVELEHVACPLPARAEHVALEALVVGVGRREGREVVAAGEQGGAGMERRLVEPVRPPQRAAVLERRGRGPREHPVHVRPRARVVPGREPGRRGLGGEHRDLRGQHGVDRAQRGQRALVGGDLAERVHAPVRPSRDGQLDPLAQHRRQRARELAGDRPLTRLGGPPREGRAVVGQSELGLRVRLTFPAQARESALITPALDRPSRSRQTTGGPA